MSPSNTCGRVSSEPPEEVTGQSRMEHGGWGSGAVPEHTDYIGSIEHERRTRGCGLRRIPRLATFRDTAEFLVRSLQKC